MSKVKVTYEKVEMSTNEIAKAMIDGEVFYSADGDYYYEWNGKSFTDSDGDCFYVFGHFYRRVETEVKWYDDIPEGGVLCWVWDTYQVRWEIDIIKEYNGSQFIGHTDTEWDQAKPLTKSEINTFIGNAPE